MRELTRIAACAFLCACTAEPELSSTESALDLSVFTLPPAAATERAAIVRAYDHVDPTDQVPRGLLEDALAYYDLNQTHIPNSDYVVVIDLSLYSGKDRFWLVDMASGDVEAHKVSHGTNSDPDNNGYATAFGNVEGSLKSSLGFALTAEIYNGSHQHSMRLDGLSPDGSPNGMANTRMRERLVVVHEASYVDDGNTSQQGRSNGCPALDPSIEVGVVDKIHGGALFYTAISALAEPVGRATCGDTVCDGDETAASCAVDCDGGADDPGPDDPPIDGEVPTTQPGGCSSTGGAGLLLAFAVVGLVGLRRRQRR
ncbi:MAG: murein L,D-transpeptidase catalytic domain family protein [Deltaproteobacteria bacterium]|nr:murein L,D-transpeptidase catalytic domain family protein [Deltaproteobacteria bacterium]